MRGGVREEGLTALGRLLIYLGRGAQFDESALISYNITFSWGKNLLLRPSENVIEALIRLSRIFFDVMNGTTCRSCRFFFHSSKKFSKKHPS